MKKQPLFFILSVILILSLTMAVFTPVLADPGKHQQEVFVVDEEWVWYGDDEYNPCGFDLYFHDTGKFRFNYWFDEYGRLSKQLEIWGNLKETISANGKTVNVQIQGPVTSSVEYQNSGNEIYTVKIRGTFKLVTVPGLGKIYPGGGMMIEVYTYDAATDEWSYNLEKAVGSYTDLEDFTAFCAYFE